MMTSRESKSGLPAGTSILKFKAREHSSGIRKRARYDPKRREEVKAMRHQRACLRCALLGLKCNDDAICLRCSGLILHTHGKQTLSFSGCVRTRCIEVKPFECNLPQVANLPYINAKSKLLWATNVTLQFDAQVTWDLSSLIDDFVGWFADPMNFNTSKVGTLSSPRFVEILGTAIDEQSKRRFRQMIYAESLAYTKATLLDPNLSNITELRQLGAVAGHEFLKTLDARMRPQTLKGSSRAEIQALFLIIVGTILAVSYTEPLVDVIDILSRNSHTTVQELPAHHYHLCKILGHYLVYLGTQLQLHLPESTERLLLLAASTRWHKEGKFNWLLNNPNQSTLMTKVQNFSSYSPLQTGHVCKKTSTDRSTKFRIRGATCIIPTKRACRMRQHHREDYLNHSMCLRQSLLTTSSNYYNFVNSLAPQQNSRSEHQFTLFDGQGFGALLGDSDGFTEGDGQSVFGQWVVEDTLHPLHLPSKLLV